MKRMRPLAALLATVLLSSLLGLLPSILPASGSRMDDQARKYRSLLNAAKSPAAFDAKRQKLGAAANMLMHASASGRSPILSKNSSLSLYRDMSGRLLVDLFIQLQDPSAASTLSALGIESRTQVGDIIVARAPVAALPALAEEPGIRRVEISQKRHARLDSSRASIGVDLVHQGLDLPHAYLGEDVIVGVIDSGIDFTHPDFNDQNGSRILHLLEFTQDGGQNEWTKSDIDNEPAGVSQRDGDGGSGHGTHVTGIAAGGGQLNAAMRGIAPAADIIFVKSKRDPDSYGGYADADVLAGCQYIFDKADQMGKPAVVNISIGNHFSPHDGTSLYEQSLSGLVGPGRLIVAAAGNEGDDFIHAGGVATAGVLNETLFIANGQFEIITMWHDPGVITAVNVFAYDTQFNFLGQAVHEGTELMDAIPFVANDDTLGFITVEKVVQDPNNGDGNIVFLIENSGFANIDITDVIWAVGSIGDANGRLDLWVATGGRVHDQIVGFPNETEMPGDNDYSVGAPATAEKVISVGGYITKYSWFGLDGTPWSIDPPLTISGRMSSSSYGPTRDERMSPDISAPGRIIFSALSSHLTEGIGYDPIAVLQGGGYHGKSGTSFASPLVTGTIALMLQVKNDLTYSEAIRILAETARSNPFTGTTPNNSVGAGYLDAHAAVKRTAGIVSSVAHMDDILPQSFVLKQNYPNPFNPSTSIEYVLAANDRAVLRIYDVTGRRIRTLVDDTPKAGTYTIHWDGVNGLGQPAASGIYYARLTAGQRTLTTKMVLIR